MRDLLFSSSYMAAMTQRENRLLLRTVLSKAKEIEMNGSLLYSQVVVLCHGT